MRIIFTFIVALPLITGLSYRDKLYDPEHLEKLRQQVQQENRAQLHGSMRQTLYIDAGTIDIMNPYGQYSHIPCNDTVEGTIVMSLPEKCMNLVCRNNLVIPQYAYGEETCNCCEHNGKMYKEGEEISGVCTKIFCCEGKWQTTGHINDCCSHCDVYGDPHIKTFDARDDVNNFYNVFSYCNNTFTQKLEETHTGSKNPDFGVYAHFRTWSDNSSSSIGIVTFTDNLHTVLEIDPFCLGLHVNGIWMDISTYDQPTPLVDVTGNKHPVLVWQEEYNEFNNTNCINVLGSQGILIHVCWHYVWIYAHPSLYEEIGGLCGYFDQYDQNDHMDRDGVFHQLAYSPEVASDVFVESWRNDINDYCIYFEKQQNDCAKNQTLLQDFTFQCTNLLMPRDITSSFLSSNQFNNMIQSCIDDMCNVGRFDSGLSLHYLMVLYDQNSQANMTIGANTVITPPCNSTSKVSTVTETKTITVTKCSSTPLPTPHTPYTSPFPTNIPTPVKKAKISEIKPTVAYNHQSTEV